MYMARTVNGSREPDEPSRASIEVKVLITVPAEFLGVSQHELQARQGWITGMEAQQHALLIHASLPSGKYDELVEAITAGTQNRGGIELKG
jgi:translation elongation factor EF-G